jgi:hypothetical protein
LILTFFGLTSNSIYNKRTQLFHEIIEIVSCGGGGYDLYTIYNTPIWLRKLIFERLKEIHNPKSSSGEESWVEGEAKEEASKNKQTIKIPDFVVKMSNKKG